MKSLGKGAGKWAKHTGICFHLLYFFSLIDKLKQSRAEISYVSNFTSSRYVVCVCVCV